MLKKTFALLAGAVLLAGLTTVVWAEEPKSETKINGKVFADFTSKSVKKGNIKQDDSGIGIDVQRFYLGVSHTFDHNWSASFVADIGDKGAKRYDVFVKNAYIQYKANDSAVIRIGAAGNPWVGYAEGIYGLRYIEKTLIDRLKIGDSADWGLHLLGKAAAGKVNYQLSAVNGLGYSDPKRTKTIDFEGRLGFEPIKGLNLGAGFYSGKRGRDLESAPAKNSANRFNLLAAFSNKQFTLGTEYFEAKNWNSVTTAFPAGAKEEKANGLSVFGLFNATPDVALFARFDTTKPDKDRSPDLKNRYFNLGIQYRFNKSFVGSLVYKNEKTETGSPSTEAKTDEFGAFVQYSF